jgi:hypothetical protein
MTPEFNNSAALAEAFSLYIANRSPLVVVTFEDGEIFLRRRGLLDVCPTRFGAPTFRSPVLPRQYWLTLISLLDPLIQRFEHSRIHRGDDIHSRIELFFGHPRFPCVRKAPIHSWIAESHHRNGETDQHLLALGETFDSVGITVEGSKVGFLQGSWLLFVNRSRWF